MAHAQRQARCEGTRGCPQLIALLPVCSMDTLRGLLDGKASDIVNSIRDAKCEDLEGLETHAKVAANFVRLAQDACKNPAARQTLGGFVIIMSPSC